MYFPDSSYQDAEVQKVYEQVSEILEAARKSKYRVILGGDFNAKVGRGEESAARPAAGMHGLGEHNSQGQWLMGWASTQSLKLANTWFRKLQCKLVATSADPIGLCIG